MKTDEVQNNLSFTSTYRIPLVAQNISTAKRDALKKMASQYQNVMYPKGNQGCVRVSIRKRLDDGFEQKLRQIGFKVFQKFEKHNIPKTNDRMDNYIRRELKSGEYKQFGKQKS
jgi:hypothetical protein